MLDTTAAIQIQCDISVLSLEGGQKVDALVSGADSKIRGRWWLFTCLPFLKQVLYVA